MKQRNPNPKARDDRVVDVFASLELRDVLQAEMAASRAPGSIPPGFTQCEKCGEFNGTTQRRHLSMPTYSYESLDDLISVSCLCRGIPCRQCGKNLIHRPISNSYDPKTNTIGHWSYLAGMIICGECRERSKETPPAMPAQSRPKARKRGQSSRPKARKRGRSRG